MISGEGKKQPQKGIYKAPSLPIVLLLTRKYNLDNVNDFSEAIKVTKVEK